MCYLVSSFYYLKKSQFPYFRLPNLFDDWHTRSNHNLKKCSLYSKRYDVFITDYTTFSVTNAANPIYMPVNNVFVSATNSQTALFRKVCYNTLLGIQSYAFSDSINRIHKSSHFSVICLRANISSIVAVVSM